MSILSDISALLFAHRCLVCREPIRGAGGEICTRCFAQISYTRFWEWQDNDMALHARDMQPIIKDAAAMLYYDSYSRDVIHRLKYRGEWRAAQYLGQVFGEYLSRSQIYESIDVVIPVPLHPIRLLQRGYNQAEYIARGIALSMGAEVNVHSLRRRRYTSAQARKSSFERWEGGEELFYIAHKERLQGRHILLVDDVYTSGATIFRCVEAISRAEVDCRISIATLTTPRG